MNSLGLHRPAASQRQRRFRLRKIRRNAPPYLQQLKTFYGLFSAAEAVASETGVQKYNKI